MEKRKYSEVVKDIEDGKYDQYSDRVDVSIEISLCEYGILRNPETGETILCLNPTNDFPDDDYDMVFRTINVTKEEVLEDLDDAEQGFFAFIGSKRADAKKALQNDFLTGIVSSLNQWDGRYTDY
jgi:hypothetical protein